MAQIPIDELAWMEAEAFRRARLAELLAETDAARRAPQNVACDQVEMRIGRHTIVLDEGTWIEVRAPVGVAVFSIDDLAEMRKVLDWYHVCVKKYRVMGGA